MEVPLRVFRHWSRCRKISTRAIEPCSNEEMGWDSEGPWLCPRHPQSLSSPVSWKLLTGQSTVNQKWQPLLSLLIFAAQGPKVKSSLKRRSREDVFWVSDRAWPFHCYSTSTPEDANNAFMSLKQEFGTQFFKKLEPYRQGFGFIQHIVLSLYQNSTNGFSCVGEYGTVLFPASLMAIIHCWLHRWAATCTAGSEPAGTPSFFMPTSCPLLPSSTSTYCVKFFWDGYIFVA